MFNWKIVVMVLIFLVVADKVITLVNLNQIKKNFPEIDPIKAEKNTIARLFFNKLGLVGGTILYLFISIITVFLALLLLNLTLGAFDITNSLSISLYIIMMWYGFVIFNNLYFFLKFSKIIP